MEIVINAIIIMNWENNNARAKKTEKVMEGRNKKKELRTRNPPLSFDLLCTTSTSAG